MTIAQHDALEDPVVAGLGMRLRAIRKAHRKSLSEVAEATGISASFLSLVETGKSDLTIGRLARIVDYFGVTLEDLVPTSPDRADPVTVTSPDDAKHIRSEGEGVDVLVLAQGGKHDLNPMELVIQPGASLSDFGYHRGDEFVHVIDGVLQIEFEGREAVVAYAGWSVTYPGTLPHRFSNTGDQVAHIVCVNSRAHSTEPAGTI